MPQIIKLTQLLYYPTRVLYYCTRVLYYRTRVLYYHIRVLYYCTRVLYYRTRVLYYHTRVLYYCTRVLYYCTRDGWNMPSSSLYNLSVSHPEVIKIIEAHHYFGLPKMKEIITKLQEEAPPTGADPE